MRILLTVILIVSTISLGFARKELAKKKLELEKISSEIALLKDEFKKKSRCLDERDSLTIKRREAQSKLDAYKKAVLKKIKAELE